MGKSGAILVADRSEAGRRLCSELEFGLSSSSTRFEQVRAISTCSTGSKLVADRSGRRPA